MQPSGTISPTEANLLRQLSTQYQARQYSKALATLEALIAQQPERLAWRCDRPYLLRKSGRFREALEECWRLLKVDELEERLRINLHDAAAAAAAELHEFDTAKQHGLVALNAKACLPPTAAVQALGMQPLHSTLARRSQQVIAFSLYGANPRYVETALLNVTEARKWFPHWVCRFYCDDSVPEGALERLEKSGAQVFLVSERVRSAMPGTFWRMLVVDDPAVERFLQRDADSVLSEREALAVEQWMASDLWFHAMRDYWSHSELLLAGMWGGRSGGLRHMQSLIEDFLRAHPKLRRDRNADQQFLRTSVWPTVSQSLYTHDSCYGFKTTSEFPATSKLPWSELIPDFHVGMNFAHAVLEVPSAQADGTVVEWMLHDGTNEICRYASVVRDGTWKVGIPLSYRNPLLDKLWHVCPPDQPSVRWRLKRPWRTATVSTVVMKRHVAV